MDNAWEIIGKESGKGEQESIFHICNDFKDEVQEIKLLEFFEMDNLKEGPVEPLAPGRWVSHPKLLGAGGLISFFSYAPFVST
jgi:hypothetical protein